MGKRTDINFSKHELLITENEHLNVWHLKKPDTYTDSIKYINTSGILAVTGDYSNWIFCREFHPDPKGYAETQYWSEKLQISSKQQPSRYDAQKTEARIKELLEEEGVSDEDKEYLNNLLTMTDDELEYTYRAYREAPRNWDMENIPFEKSLDYHFLVVLDGFDEICNRLKLKEG